MKKKQLSLMLFSAVLLDMPLLFDTLVFQGINAYHKRGVRILIINKNRYLPRKYQKKFSLLIYTRLPRTHQSSSVILCLQQQIIIERHLIVRSLMKYTINNKMKLTSSEKFLNIILVIDLARALFIFIVRPRNFDLVKLHKPRQ